MINIPISEIFYSLQGEWPNTGKPSIFVRFWGCNLKCSWCDSKYAWHKDHIKEMKTMELYDICNLIESFDGTHVIFTGGEPAMFQDKIWLIMEGLDWYTFEIETNGSFPINLQFDQVNVSYKFLSSGNKKYELKALWEDYAYKFVVNSKEDREEMEAIIAEHNLKNIYIMPLGRTSDSQDRDDLMQYCMRHNYNYCPRQHIKWFGDKKGV